MVERPSKGEMQVSLEKVDKNTGKVLTGSYRTMW
jgi:hypothetical protein